MAAGVVARLLARPARAQKEETEEPETNPGEGRVRVEEGMRVGARVKRSGWGYHGG